MRSSSAKQLEFEYSTAGGGQSSGVSAGDASSPGAVSDEAIKFPDFSPDPAVAAAARIAGRINAAHISDLDFDQFLRERTRLLDKKLDETITKRESNRLEYVLWTLDRIEDARTGQALEALEGYVNHYEAFLTDLHSLQVQLESKLPRRKRAKKR